MLQPRATGGKTSRFEFIDILTMVTFAAAIAVCLLDAVFGIKAYWLIFIALVLYCLGAPWFMRRREKREAAARAERMQRFDKK